MTTELYDVPFSGRSLRYLDDYQLPDFDPKRYPLRSSDRSVTVALDQVPDVLPISDWLLHFHSITVYARCNGREVIGLTLDFADISELIHFKTTPAATIRSTLSTYMVR
jgi:hypothetical protein